MDEIERYLISILLPIGSLRPWLADCLESVKLASKSLNVELVVVLNNLGVEEQKLVVSMVEAIWDRELQLLVDNSNNLSDVLNVGIRNTKGKFVARIDDDDLMEPDRLLVQTQYLETYPKTVLVGGATKVVSADGIQLRINRYPIFNRQIKRMIRYGNCFAHSTVMFSRENAILVGLYEDKYLFAEDYHFWTKLAHIGELHNIEKPVGSYRIHQSQLNLLKKSRQIVSVKQIINDIGDQGFGEFHSLRRDFTSGIAENHRTRKDLKNLKIRSRQYFAIARLYADGSRRLNTRSVGYLVASFFANPIEFSGILMELLSFRMKREVLNL